MNKLTVTGQTVEEALQTLTQAAANQYFRHFIKVTLDSGNYRKKRKETLTQLAAK
ncbi:MAG: hypothetical protein IMW92_04960 [Bacillales bacterium]|nr:hypothetical protein [Bacillales bacterium]